MDDLKLVASVYVIHQIWTATRLLVLQYFQEERVT